MLQFSVKDTVNAAFTYAINYGCIKDSVLFFHPAGNGVNYWKWDIDENQQSALQNPQALYSVFNQKQIQLIVSNGFCNDTSNQIILLENFLKADFSVFKDNCPSEPVPFTGSAKGKIVTHSWDFGDGGTATAVDPSHIYTVPFQQTTYTVRLCTFPIKTGF